MKGFVLSLLFWLSLSCMRSQSFDTKSFIRMDLDEFETGAEQRDRMLLHVKKPKVILKETEPHGVLQCQVGFGKWVARTAMSTLSADTWIPTKDCHSCLPKRSQKRLYRCEKPCRFHGGETKTHTALPNLHGGISFKGKKALDTMHLAHAHAPNTEVILATSVKRNDKIPVDGVLGFGVHDKNILTQLKTANKIQQAQFAYFLGEGHKFVSIGNHQKYLADSKFFNYKRSDKGQRWSIKVNGMNFHNKAQGTGLATKNTEWVFDISIIDYLVPTASYDKIKKSLITVLGGGSNQCKEDSKTKQLYCDCSANLKKMPTIQVAFVGSAQNWEMTPETYGEIKHGKCYTNLIKSTKQEWVIGRKFLRHFYTIFDQDNNQISISKANPRGTGSLYMSRAVRGVVIALGIIAVIISVAVLLLILKQINPATVKKQVPGAGQQRPQQGGQFNQQMVSQQSPHRQLPLSNSGHQQMVQMAPTQQGQMRYAPGQQQPIYQSQGPQQFQQGGYIQQGSMPQAVGYQQAYGQVHY